MRDIDIIISYINELEFLSPIEKIILINRINERPTEEEYDKARKELKDKESC